MELESCKLQIHQADSTSSRQHRNNAADTPSRSCRVYVVSAIALCNITTNRVSFFLNASSTSPFSHSCVLARKRRALLSYKSSTKDPLTLPTRTLRNISPPHLPWLGGGCPSSTMSPFNIYSHFQAPHVLAKFMNQRLKNLVCRGVL